MQTDNQEFTVAYWRNYFHTELKPKLDKNWHRQLADVEPTLDSLKGANDMRAVSHNKASLVVTKTICYVAERVIKGKNKRRTLTLQQRINRAAKNL
ncbi:hypothetical protein [Spirosoma fluminis]